MLRQRLREIVDYYSRMYHTNIEETRQVKELDAIADLLPDDESRAKLYGAIEDIVDLIHFPATLEGFNLALLAQNRRDGFTGSIMDVETNKGLQSMKMASEKYKREVDIWALYFNRQKAKYGGESI